MIFCCKIVMLCSSCIEMVRYNLTRFHLEIGLFYEIYFLKHHKSLFSTSCYFQLQMVKIYCYFDCGSKGYHTIISLAQFYQWNMTNRKHFLFYSEVVGCRSFKAATEVLKLLSLVLFKSKRRKLSSVGI